MGDVSVCVCAHVCKSMCVCACVCVCVCMTSNCQHSHPQHEYVSKSTGSCSNNKTVTTELSGNQTEHKQNSSKLALSFITGLVSWLRRGEGGGLLLCHTWALTHTRTSPICHCIVWGFDDAVYLPTHLSAHLHSSKGWHWSFCGMSIQFPPAFLKSTLLFLQPLISCGLSVKPSFP